MSSDRIDRLWGCGDIEKAFPTGGAITTTPWQRGNMVKHGRAYDQDAARRILSAPVGLVDIDPRDLRCSQPSIVRHHVDYYLKGWWEISGQTSADQHAEHNRFPLLVRNHQGHNLILSGHHRTAAARIAGRPVRARVIAMDGSYYVTPLLRVEPNGATSTSAQLAASLLIAGEHAVVPDLESAAEALGMAGASTDEISLAVGLASRRSLPIRDEEG